MLTKVILKQPSDL